MRRFLVAAAALLGLTVVSSLPAAAQEDDTGDDIRTIVVIEVSGLLDPVVVSYIEEQVAAAVAQESLAVVLQVNSPGAVVDDAALLDLLDELDVAEIPLVVWVGQSGAKALGGAAHLVTVADYTAMSTSSRIGDFGALDNPRASAFDRYRDNVAGVDEAIDQGIVDGLAPLVGELLLILEAEGLLTEISVPAEEGAGLRSLRPDVQVQFAKLDLIDQQFHTVASPAVAYLLLLIGLSMIMLDFFTGGVGVAGVVGAVCLLLSAYGLGVLDLRMWALVVLVVAMLGFAIDLQSGVPRFWTVVGSLCLVIGSLFLFEDHGFSWITLVSGVGLTLAFMLSGMPALIRTRYGTSTLGREWMIGRMGVADTDIDPEGLISLDGATWRARVNRLTPLSVGDPVRIVSLDGLVVEVEPEHGGAKDYRQMRQRDHAAEVEKN